MTDITNMPVAQEKAPDAKKVAVKKKPEPTSILMLKDFRIEYPLPCRRDASMILTLKAGQEITDKFMIKHLLTNPEAPFIVQK